MSTMKLIELAKDFLNNKVDSNKFSSDVFTVRRELYGASGQSKEVLNCGEELFMLAEVFNPEPDRENYEIDETQLREKVKETLIKFNLQ